MGARLALQLTGSQTEMRGLWPRLALMWCVTRWRSVEFTALADNQEVLLDGSAAATTKATYLSPVAGASVQVSGANWLAVAVKVPGAGVRLFGVAEGTQAPGYAAWVTAASATIAPDPAVPVTQVLGAVSEELAQRDAGWCDDATVGLSPEQYM